MKKVTYKWLCIEVLAHAFSVGPPDTEGLQDSVIVLNVETGDVYPCLANEIPYIREPDRVACTYADLYNDYVVPGDSEATLARLRKYEDDVNGALLYNYFHGWETDPQTPPDYFGNEVAEDAS